MLQMRDFLLKASSGYPPSLVPPQLLLDKVAVASNLQGYAPICFGLEDIYIRRLYLRIQFQATYGKPLQAARDAKCSAKDSEAGVLAMEALHKQVMPFLLRRTKDQVLTDLPEKIIQDRHCDLSAVQLKLYEKFSGSHVRQEISSMVKVNETGTGEGNAPSKTSSHVFQALQYLLKLCSHPLLVLGEKNQDLLPNILPDLFPMSSDIGLELHKLHHSPKLVALQEILEECGIGVEPLSSEGSVSVGQHRVLIFAQHKAFLDIIEKDLFRVHMKKEV